jgi:hypothetical protein
LGGIVKDEKKIIYDLNYNCKIGRLEKIKQIIKFHKDFDINQSKLI